MARTCQRLGISVVFGVSEADRDAPWTRGHEQIVLGPARSAGSYLCAEKVVQAAVQTRCSALHPGWGFLAESPLLATLCVQHGVTFIGPPAHVMHLMGKKTPAKKAMGAAGLTLIPGSDGVLSDVDDARQVAEEVGYPVLLKAESGGGGRGMRIARDASEIARAYEDAQAEAIAAFSDGRLYLEKLVEAGRHVEIQLLADNYGHAVHLGERDCTVQRNHQKLIEESPAPSLSAAERARTLDAAVAATRAIGYTGAGTMEFLLDSEGVLRFMEMNTRLQVEHCVSELRTGIDLVEQQIRVAAGHPLGFEQRDIELKGHAIECRINAEHPWKFTPSPGRITGFNMPGGPGVRIDCAVHEQAIVQPFYDSLIGKLIVHANSREEAIIRMQSALSETIVEGVETSIPLHRELMSADFFANLDFHTRYLERWISERLG